MIAPSLAFMLAANTFAYCFTGLPHHGLTDCETVLSVRW